MVCNISPFMVDTVEGFDEPYILHDDFVLQKCIIRNFQGIGSVTLTLISYSFLTDFLSMEAKLIDIEIKS